MIFSCKRAVNSKVKNEYFATATLAAGTRKVENDRVLCDCHFGGESLGCKLCLSQVATATLAAILLVIN